MNEGGGNEPGRTVTHLLQEWRGGNQAALDEVIPLVYRELHNLAASYMRRERAGHTFRPTDLVAEAYVRLAEGTNPHWNDRVHFFGIAARTMRQILVDHARKRNADKRGAGERAVTFEEDQVAARAERPDDMIALDDAMTELAKIDERKARTIELHYFAGMTQEEIAAMLEVHVNTVARDLKLAEAWIARHLRGTTS